MRHVTLAYVIFVLTSLLPKIHGYSGGAPVAQCDAMTPNHGANMPTVVDSTVPYNVSASSDTYYPGQMITVTVQSTTDGTTFKGLMLQARDTSSARVGTFSLMSMDNTLQLLSCDGTPGTAVTHTSGANKDSISVYWQAPAMDDGNVIFRATIVQQFDTFYVGVVSSPISFMPMASMENGSTTMATMTTTDTMADSSAVSAMTGSAVMVLFAVLCGHLRPV